LKYVRFMAEETLHTTGDVQAKARCMRLGTAATIQVFGAQENVTPAMARETKFAHPEDAMSQR